MHAPFYRDCCVDNSRADRRRELFYVETREGDECCLTLIDFVPLFKNQCINGGIRDI